MKRRWLSDKRDRIESEKRRAARLEEVRRERRRQKHLKSSKGEKVERG